MFQKNRCMQCIIYLAYLFKEIVIIKALCLCRKCYLLVFGFIIVYKLTIDHLEVVVYNFTTHTHVYMW